MIRVKVPATSANLGPGFDVLGIAFGLYNSFRFEKAKTYKMIDFEERYQNPNRNLVCRSYKKVFEMIGVEPIPVHIYMDDQEVPTSRGLGSSATCIVAGVLAAKHFLGDQVSYEKCFQIASLIEGHPDNIAPAMFGGLVASYTIDGVYKHIRYDVSSNLKFNVLVPPFELNTHESRKALPKVLNYQDIVYNTARIANIPYAVSKGDLSLLIELMSDKMHEPYRMKLIEGSYDIKNTALNNGCAFAISGAGPSLLVVSDKNINELFSNLKGWKIFNLNVARTGAIIEEM